MMAVDTVLRRANGGSTALTSGAKNASGESRFSQTSAQGSATGDDLLVQSPSSRPGKLRFATLGFLEQVRHILPNGGEKW